MKKLIMVLSLVLLAGCATTRGITSQLEIGMTKEEVLKKCGQPYKISASKSKAKNGEDVLVTAFVYKVDWWDQMDYSRPENFLEICFVNGKITQWGTGYGWKTVADYEGTKKYDIEIRNR